jgi:hypothetical protein
VSVGDVDAEVRAMLKTRGAGLLAVGALATVGAATAGAQNGGTSPQTATPIGVPQTVTGTLAGASSSGPVGWCFPGEPMVWYQVTPTVDTVMDVQVGVASGLSPWFAVNLASSQSGIFCASSGATTGRVAGAAFLQGGQSYSLVVGGNGTAFTLLTSFGTPLRAIRPGRRVRQRIGNLR